MRGKTARHVISPFNEIVSAVSATTGIAGCSAHPKFSEVETLVSAHAHCLCTHKAASATTALREVTAVQCAPLTLQWAHVA
eukprot:6191437-Pleurochrysis_carterae.AAC.1